MNFTVLTLFPELIEPFLNNGMVGRARENGIISGTAINIRDFAFNRHNSVDDRPYGGGCGMVMRPEPLANAIRHAKLSAPGSRVILMSPQGLPFDQNKACELASAMQGLI
ncbi:MAG: tRNA (guanosine(37)-N1)-methyltransferase TrmD, partial [Desulfamplus sp.]|nr:tRNA (guanosine(37)-N1)-methyltransferase TrmD [Desulfamplus sp.]